MRLPEAFKNRMRTILEDEFAAFLSTYENHHARGLVLNTLKVEKAPFLSRFPHRLEAVAWHEDGFYFSDVRALGADPYHHAGLFYMQEPSAMAPAAVLAAKPGERVLDLCAAPGGKSVSMALSMQGEGVLVTNDSEYPRARVLSQNIERMGIPNAIVTNHRAEGLAERFPSFFDAVMVDVPCSLEGMFKKEPEALSLYREDLPERMAPLQERLLENAFHMTRPGGRIVYSTCTFNTIENEGVVRDFLKKHTDAELLEIPKHSGLQAGIGMEEALRIWPHKVRGEGHFIVLIRKTTEANIEMKPTEKGIKRPPLYAAFAAETLNRPLEGTFLKRKDTLYLFPGRLFSLAKLSLLRVGIMLGQLKKRRFVPAHALAHARAKEDFRRSLDYGRDRDEIHRYLRGETLRTESANGIVVVCVDGFPLGFAKAVDGVLKNHYPKGLRIIG